MVTNPLRLVRHRTTRAYLGNDGQWTQDYGAARNFEDIQTVLNLQRQRNLTEIEVVLQIGSEPSPDYDIALPLQNPLG